MHFGSYYTLEESITGLIKIGVLIIAYFAMWAVLVVRGKKTISNNV